MTSDIVRTQVISRTLTENGLTSTWNDIYAYNSYLTGDEGLPNTGLATVTVTDPNGENDEIADLNLLLDGLEPGHFLALRQNSNLDSALISATVSLDFCTTFSDDDEVFHIACPEHSWISSNAKLGWQIGPSNEP